MPTVLAPNGIPLLQLYLLVALPAEILRCRTSVVHGGTEGGAGGGAGGSASGSGLARAGGDRGDVDFVGRHFYLIGTRFGLVFEGFGRFDKWWDGGL